METDKSRTLSSTRNIVSSITYQILLTLFRFASRTIFIRVLGVELLGLSGLFANILSVLSLVELGIGSAMVYSMYKPLADNDTKKLSALMAYYKRIYIIIGILVFIVGLILMPFLNFFINTESAIQNINIYYLLFVINASISYFFIYKATLINADQKLYITKFYIFIFEFLRLLSQILVLLLTGNYIVFLMIQVVSTLLCNVFISIKANRLYPFIKEKAEKIDKTSKKEIDINIKSLFMYRMSGVILNNTDNILISVIVGTVWVGYYNNYYLIIGILLTFIDLLFKSISASIGNLNTDQDIKTQETVYKAVNFTAFWIYSFASISLFILFKDFIYLWLGKDFLLKDSITLIIITNFYIQGILYGTKLFRHATGLFKETKYIVLVTALMNIILSIILGKLFGLIGILGATIIARVLTNIWYEPYILHKKHFKKRSKSFFIKATGYASLTVFIGGLMLLFSRVIPEKTVGAFILKAFMCLIIPNLIILLVFRKSKEYKYIKQKLIYLIKQIKNNKNNKEITG